MQNDPASPVPHRGGRRAFAGLAAAALALSGVTVAAAPANAAPAVPNVKKLAGELSKQKLTWETCDFGSKDLNDRFNQPNVKCATVKVPRDWHHPENGKTWDIRISQAKNIDVKNPRYKGTIFANPGGPGGSGLPWGAALQQRTPDMNPYYNYVGFDPRGVGQSSHATCDYEFDPSSSDHNAEVKAMGAACSTNEDVKTINTEQTVYDMDFVRHLLGAPKLSYVGYSYGTWLGAWYGNLFGKKYGDKLLLDSSTDVTDATLQKTWDFQPKARDRQFEKHLMNWIARHDATYGLGTDPQKIYADYNKGVEVLGQDLAAFGWLLSGGYRAFPDNSAYPAAANVVRMLAKTGASADAPKAQRRAAAADVATQADAALATLSKDANAEDAKRIAEGRALLKDLAKLPEVKDSTPAASARSSAPSAEKALKKVTADDAFNFIRCNDGQWTQGAAYWDAKNAKDAPKYPLSDTFGSFSKAPVCAFWRTGNMMPVANGSFPQTVVIQGEQDSQTAWETGRISGLELPNTSFIAIDNEGSHGHFPYGTEAVDRPVYDFFLKGKQPADLKVTQAKPLPQEDVTYESWKKLNKKAQHTGADAASPWVPTSSQAKLTRDLGLNELMADQQSEHELRQLVQRTYGEAGLKTLAKHQLD